MVLKEVLLNKFREATGADERVLSDRTINEIMDSLGLPEDNEEAISGFVEKFTPIFTSMAGQTRAVIAKLENGKGGGNTENKKEANKTEKVENKENQNTGVSQEVLDLLSKQSETILELKNSLDGIKNESLTKNKVSMLDEYAKSSGYNDGYVYGKAKQMIDLSDKSIEELQKELDIAYASEFKACRGAEPVNAGAGSGGKDVEDAEWEDFFKRRREQEAYYKQ